MGAVLIGGIKRIASVSQIVVPFMAVAYFVFALILIICNITKVPAAVVTVVQGAFHPRAVTGGVVGSMFVAMQNGVARGIFSNEAGLVVRRSQRQQRRHMSRCVRDLSA